MQHQLTSAPGCDCQCQPVGLSASQPSVHQRQVLHVQAMQAGQPGMQRIPKLPPGRSSGPPKVVIQPAEGQWADALWAPPTDAPRGSLSTPPPSRGAHHA